MIDSIVSCAEEKHLPAYQLRLIPKGIAFPHGDFFHMVPSLQQGIESITEYMLLMLSYKDSLLPLNSKLLCSKNLHYW